MIVSCSMLSTCAIAKLCEFFSGVEVFLGQPLRCGPAVKLHQIPTCAIGLSFVFEYYIFFEYPFYVILGVRVGVHIYFLRSVSGYISGLLIFDPFIVGAAMKLAQLADVKCVKDLGHRNR